MMRKKPWVHYTPFIGLLICALIHSYIIYQNLFVTASEDNLHGPSAKLDSFHITPLQVWDLYESGNLTRDIFNKILQLRVLPFTLLLFKSGGRFSQVVKCHTKKSAKGLSIKFFFLDTVSNLMQMSYHSYHGLYILLYMDTYCFTFINSIIILQMYWYKEIHWKQAIFTIIVAYGMYQTVQNEIWTYWIVGAMYICSGIMYLYSRTVLVYVIFDAQDYGNLYVGQFMILIGTISIDCIVFMVGGANWTVLVFTFNVI